MNVDRSCAQALADTVQACRELIDIRFAGQFDEGAAAMLLADGTIVTGTAPACVNPSVEVCHEIEPFCAAYRLDQPVRASICLHREDAERFVVLSPCGVCRERLAIYGPDVLVAVPGEDAAQIVWKPLCEVHGDYWRAPFLPRQEAERWRQGVAPSV
ncbi:cytidine deaminase [Arsenicicoccus dermatophilus]|uniref:cytidine deaminase n=1 Tax=Arsenicicoccus dermatophilus TaxID=1076331 RepID=UPI003916E6A3